MEVATVFLPSLFASTNIYSALHYLIQPELDALQYFRAGSELETAQKTN